MKTSITLAGAGVAALALGGAFVVGATVGPENWGPSGGDERSRPSTQAQEVGAGQPLAAGDLSLVAAGDCDTLLEWYVDNTRDLVTAWGWGGGFFAYDGIRRNAMPLADTASALGAGPGAVEARAKAGSEVLSQSSSETGTNVQEVGVDEPDVVKTDGELLVRLSGDDLVLYDVTGKEPERLTRFDLPGRATDAPVEMLLVGDEAVVLQQRFTPDGAVTEVHRIDLTEPSSPDLLDTTSYAAGLLSARLQGDTVRLVLSTGLPDLDFVTPHGKLTRREALRQNREVLEESTIGAWLPSVAVDGDGPEQLVDCADMARPEDFTSAGTISVVGWSADDPQDRSSTGVATGSQIVYSSTDRLYLATSAWGGCGPLMDCAWGGRGLPGIWPGPVPGPRGDEGTTQLHAFALDGRDASYLGSGEVEGSVRDRWAMDAVDGTLRVAVGATAETGNWNSVVTLRETDGALEPLGRVDRLGVNEQIMSVRWFDDLAVLVTFRQVDPLYAIDLSDPAKPRSLGELKITGFSDYLHPIGDDRILGLGVDADERGRTRGGQIGVFDLADPRDPKRLDVATYARDSQVHAGHEPRQFTWLPERSIALAVVSRHGRMGGSTGWVSVVRVAEDGSLRRHGVLGATGHADVAALRTVPLPDGRVVMVTEDDAAVLDLG